MNEQKERSIFRLQKVARGLTDSLLMCERGVHEGVLYNVSNVVSEIQAELNDHGWAPPSMADVTHKDNCEGLISEALIDVVLADLTDDPMGKYGNLVAALSRLAAVEGRMAA